MFYSPAAAILLGSPVSCLMHQGAGGLDALQGQGRLVGQERRHLAAESCCPALLWQGGYSLLVMGPSRPIKMVWSKQECPVLVVS